MDATVSALVSTLCALQETMSGLEEQIQTEKLLQQEHFEAVKTLRSRAFVVGFEVDQTNSPGPGPPKRAQSVTLAGAAELAVAEADLRVTVATHNAEVCRRDRSVVRGRRLRSAERSRLVEKS